MSTGNRGDARKNKIKSVKLTSGKDSFPQKITYENKNGEIRDYYLVETKRGKLRLESFYVY